MKQFMIFIILMTLLTAMASAVTVTLDNQGILANQSFQSSATVTPNILVVGNSSTWNCILYTDENDSNGQGSWRAVQTDSGVTNNTQINFSQRQSILEVSGITYNWDVFCNSTDDTVGNWGGGSNVTNAIGAFQYAVDITNPSISVVTPSDNFWDTDGLINLNITVVDNNVDSCILTSTMNSTSNTTQPSTAYSAQAYTNNTAFTFTGFDGILTKMAENNTGAYTWSVSCNDSATNTGTLSSRTIWVDTIAPSAFDFNLSLFKTDNRLLFNATTATDYTPQVGWGLTVELNFSKYEIRFITGSTIIEKTISAISTLFTDITSLVADTTYTINITAYDLAGNTRKITTPFSYQYSTDSTNRALSSGWNIIGNVGNSFNLSDLRTWTGATTVSVWNATHQFQSHVSGGNYGDVNVNAGDVVFIFLNSAINFSDLIHNATAVDAEAHNITNQSASTWNIIMMRDDSDDKLFGEMDAYLNCKTVPLPFGVGCGQQANNATFVDYFSKYNNTGSSGSKYIPFVANWSISNTTTMSYGETVWLFLDGTEKTNILINWTAIV